MGRILLTYAEAQAAGPKVAGGKGWNLGRLNRYGFPVPRGGVLSTEVYHEIIARPGVSRLIEALECPTAEAVETESVCQRLEAIREAYEQAMLPEEAVVQLDNFLRQEDLDTTSVAVRSSAAAEDGAAASFAGIHESVLNVTGVEAILSAVRRCFASLWTPRALAYRRRLGIADSDCGCAAVICQMIASPGGGPPRAAGVVFSCDPRTGRQDLVVINAAPGLGDALVRGAVSPQQFVVRPSGMHRPIVERPDAAMFARLVLTDDQVLELALLALRVHWALGDGQDPQDIEWAHDGERFWLVQARPVTSLPRWTFRSIAGQPVNWSNANVKEVVPGVVTTMTWSMLLGVVSRTLFTVQEVVGYDVPPGMEVVRRLSGRGYFDLTGMQWAFYDALGGTPADLNRDLGGAQPEIAIPPGHPLRGTAGRRRVRARLKLLARLGRLDREIGPKMARLHDEARAVRGFDLGRHALPDLHRELLRWEDIIWDFCPSFQLAGAYCAAWLRILRSLGTRLDPQQGESLACRLLAGTSQVTSAEHGYRVWDLAQVARRDARALAWLDATRNVEVDQRDPHAWKSLPASSAFRQALESYLDEFGHRAIVEAEIAQPRWIEDPSFLLAQVRAELAGSEPSNPRAAAARVRAAAEADLRRTTWLFRALAFWVVRRARRGMALREASKSAVVAVLEPMRRITLEVGRRLVAAGHLDEVEEVFHLANRDLEAYLLGQWDGRGARSLAVDRRAQRLAWLAESPPDVITWAADAEGHAVARPTAHPAARVLTKDATESVARWLGVPAAPGRGTGTACVLCSPLEGRRLRRGDVLVAPSTDPGWTPLFLRACAVVMETGGYISHGAIVAREYGLPAVVNLPGILQHIADGDRLVVDGDTGEVIRLAESNRSSDPTRVS
jgi:pyruvate,water dikinase